MSDMGGMAPLTWASFLGSWRVAPGWLAVAVVLAGGYCVLRVRGRGRSTVRVWRAASFVLGCVILWVCVASGIGAYSMSVFWMHMVLHLTLIMVVPVLLVLGHPITVALESASADRQSRARRLVSSRPMGLLTHPAAGLAIYTLVIVVTHLTGFMDQMVMHPWLMTGEQVLYVVAGYLFFLPLLGEEPLHSDPGYLLRLVLFLIAMLPDTVVGIVLLQTTRDPFPMMMEMHPSWAPAPLTDIHTAGGLMWAVGDGLMMFAAVGLMISVVTSPAKRDRMTGSWLDAVRRTVIATEVGADPKDQLDPDSDEAHEAYNRMLQRLAGEQKKRP
ncbi:putative copper resistance protein D [Kribbella aluminosa]|uniref:Copper resistance protein D n=1 Tax=Kribbella aluminosa TaxID=416017 RepID=A0ABS4ULN6_9ACTN|nr:cytochrome c oxidase assembly protein [Kribbella aluminosa]MBP2352558.1 putative copper resistance protein D [Kribbella aluminosa]